MATRDPSGTPGIARAAVAEGAGTFILVFFGVGSAVFGIDQLGPVGVALAFGLTLLALAYALGPVSGCHVNPAVTLGVRLRGGISTRDMIAYWGAQVVGAVIGAAVLRIIASDFGGAKDVSGGFGTNDWGEHVSAAGAFVLEVVLTFLLVFVVLLVTSRQAAPGFAGLAIGLVLTAIHLVGVPLDGTSVNPARSIGPALLHGGTPLAHVWLFVVAPLVGAVIAAVVAPAFETSTAPDVDPTGVDVPADDRRRGDVADGAS